MKAFETPLIKEQLTQGLRRFYKERRNSFSLVKCHNLEPTEHGLMPYKPVIPAFDQEYLATQGLGVSWPFPQLFLGKRKFLYADYNKIYMINPEDWGAGLYPLTTYDIANPTVEKAITPGQGWSFVDFGETWYLTNGACTVFHVGRENMKGETDKVYIQDESWIDTGIDFKGRVVFGGLDPEHFWNSTWQTFWNTWRTKQVDTGIQGDKPYPSGDVNVPMDEDFLWWSTIGGADAFILFAPEYATSGFITSSYGASKPILFDLWKRGDFGFGPLEVGGKVRDLKQLGDFLIAYTTRGVVALKNIVEPMPTLAQNVLLRVGIANKGAVASNGSIHIFLDNSGVLWSINEKLEPQPLGYQEFLQPLIGNNPQIFHIPDSYDLSGFGKFLIASDQENFCLTSRGLFSTSQKITAAHFYAGQVYGLGETMEETEEAYIKIDNLDFLERGFKTVQEVHLGVSETLVGEETSFISAQLDYKYKLNDEWSSTEWRPLNDQGWVYFGVSGLEFRLKIKTTKCTRMDLEYTKITYQTPDRRFRRAVNTGALS